MSKPSGYAKLVEIRGVPVFVHWSLPTGGILVSFVGHVEPREWVYYCVAFTLLVVVHEVGHLLAAAVLRLKVFAVEISGLGGICRVERPRRVLQSFFLYSSGLLLQVVSFLAALTYMKFSEGQKSTFSTAMLITFTLVNAVVFVLNLIPGRVARSGLATDGLVLWQLLLHVFLGHRHPHPPLVPVHADKAPIFPPETMLLNKPGFCPPGFAHGIEMLNDRTTPMDFVVSSMMTHLGMTQNEAIVKMLEIHNTGGSVIALKSAEDAHAIANAIAADARSAGHSLVCRYVGTQPLAVRAQEVAAADRDKPRSG
jgi:ATP-dependent Clp protease adapter protein ClpS